MQTRLSISPGMVIPSTHGDGWKYTYFDNGKERESDLEYANAPTAKQAMREYVEYRRDQLDQKEA